MMTQLRHPRPLTHGKQRVSRYCVRKELRVKQPNQQQLTRVHRSIAEP